jgi:hypothetical protein
VVRGCRDGALTLSDVISPTLSIVCEPCNRHGRYSVARLAEEHGDAKPTKVVYGGSGLARRRRCSWSAQGGSLMTANCLLPAAIAALALAGAARAQETGSDVASTGKKVFRRFASLRIPLPAPKSGVRRCVQVRSIPEGRRGHAVRAQA